jgi:hypothetical protein
MFHASAKEGSSYEIMSGRLNKLNGGLCYATSHSHRHIATLDGACDCDQLI